MIKREAEYMEAYKMPREIPVSECYMGQKCCGTCMYCKRDNSFENEYCLCAKKVGSR